MKKILHKAESRGHADHGWLNTYHSFSFADYYNPEKIHFGTLRVLNDDWIASGKGFGMHPHDNMEIITIPLVGELEHKDSMGNHGVINAGEIQVMSAGTGIYHSEFNKSTEFPLQLLQIWVLSNKKNVIPRYNQITLSEIAQPNKLYQILSPNEKDQGVWIYQEAWFHLGDFSANWTEKYVLKGKNTGVYFFLIEGNVTIAGEVLNRRDGLGVSEISEIEIRTNTTTKLLVMEVPMY